MLNKQNPAYQQFFIEYEQELKAVQPDVWYFADSLAKELQRVQRNFTTANALLVNSIVDFSSYCTSIVAMNETTVVHVRNLDFDFPKNMQKLIYNQKFVRGGEVIASAPSIAGFYGVYTALVPTKFSLSYNVRYSADSFKSKGGSNKGPSMLRSSTDIWKNLRLELDPEYMPFQNLLQDVVVSA
mmetsp:Transcript_14283/g.24307  ORF Transcript_14283/g.24307 Transcript_14283/m.24307 type:complete len:184 (-) Transcript_14283:493-1044(-)